MTTLVVDDRRTFSDGRPDVLYARTAQDGIEVLKSAGHLDQLWLDHDLGDGIDIGPLVRALMEAGHAGIPYPVDHVYVHTANIVKADVMVLNLTPWYNVLRVSALSNGLVDLEPW